MYVLQRPKVCIAIILVAISLPVMAGTGVFNGGSVPVDAAVKLAAPQASSQTYSIQWSRHPRAVKYAYTASSPTYTVRDGDTLSSIARKLYGSASDWPALWYSNRKLIKNPDAIRSGMILTQGSHTATEAMLKAALAAIPAPPPAAPSTNSSPPPDTSQPSSPQPTSPAPTGPWPDGALGACIVMAESGGDPNIWNATGHWGLYQFASGTWYGYGAAPGTFGNASAGYQEQIFMNVVAAGPQAVFNAWEADGCPQKFGL